MAQTEALIELEDLTKVFCTDEMETHALSGVHLTMGRANTWPFPGPRAAASPPCCPSSACSIRPRDGTYRLNGKPVEKLKFAERSRIRNREIGFIFQAST